MIAQPQSQMGPAADWRLSALQRQLLKWATDRQIKSSHVFQFVFLCVMAGMSNATAWSNTLHGCMEFGSSSGCEL
jgi:hypothetical protein